LDLRKLKVDAWRVVVEDQNEAVEVGGREIAESHN
jgi:hypothetical protein